MALKRLRAVRGMCFPRPAAIAAGQGETRARAALGGSAAVALGIAIWLSGLLLALGVGQAQAQTPPGTAIENFAIANFFDGGGNPQVESSNLDRLIVAAPRTPATIELLRYTPGAPGAISERVGPESCSTTGTTAGPFTASPTPSAFAGAAINLGVTVEVSSSSTLHAGEPIFLRVADSDQNTDAFTVETVDIVISGDLGDQEVLRLSETGPNTGIFIGYLMSTSGASSPGDCEISVSAGNLVGALYSDPADASDTANDSSLVDPFGRVFDSGSGAPVDGAQITLIDSFTGLPAAVVGDDGVSNFPSVIVSGASATDSGGATYNFGPGEFRFPFVLAGQYELRVAPPAAYTHPSVVSTTAIQSLPTAPFAIVTGSRGEVFTVPIGSIVQIDIPLDSFGTGLVLSKRAGKSNVGVGEFVPYSLLLSNPPAAAIAEDAVLTDRLPVGFRYEKRSARIDGIRIADPTISPDGRVLEFDLGDVAPGAEVDIRYVARVLPNVRVGNSINRAIVETPAGGASNEATASVEVVPDLLNQQAYLVGRVMVGECDDAIDQPHEGVENVRLYLENGTFVVSDEKGRFHFAAISPGVHVVQLDTDSLPDEYEAVACEADHRQAGRAFSQFVDVRAGSLWRTDFYLRLKPPVKGALRQMLAAEVDDRRIRYSLDISTDAVSVSNATATILLPEEISFEEGSARIGSRRVTTELMDSILVLRLGDLEAARDTRVEFEATADADADGKFVTRSMLRAQAPNGARAQTPAAGVEFPLVAPKVVESPALEPEIAAAAFVEQADYTLARVAHRLIALPRARTVFYALQVFVEPDLPSVSVAEVVLPDKQKLLANAARNEAGTPIEMRQEGQTLFFTLPRELSEAAPEVYLADGRPQVVMQVFFTTAYEAPPPGVASSRMLPIRRVVSAWAPDGFEAPGIESGTQSGDAAPAVDAVPSSSAPDAAVPETTARSTNSLGDVLTAAVVPAKTYRSESQSVEVEAPGFSAPAAREQERPEEVEALPVEEEFGLAWLSQAQPGSAWVYPASTHRPKIPSLKVGVKHHPTHRVHLTINGEVVSGLNFDGRQPNADKTVAISRWRGLDLSEGGNLLLAIIEDEDGNEIDRLERSIHLSGPPVRARLVEERSSLIADGRLEPTVAVEFRDRWGEPVREGATGLFRVDPPYQTEEEVEMMRTQPLAGLGFDLPTYVVGEDGIAEIRLHPTSVVGDARLHFRFADNNDEELAAWLEPGDRDWVLVGLATETVGWNDTSGNDDTRRAEGAEDSVYEEGRVAFFAKGRVRGSWLVTAAYDSKPDESSRRNRLLQALDPDEHYTLYGDDTQQDYDAPSSKKIYLKVERKKFYALYGDYDTGLDESELSRYNRTLTGAQTEYRGEKLQWNAFLTDSSQQFVKDEMLGDGTSGLYRLSRGDVLINSESIRLETRDRFRTELVLDEEVLTRSVDYNIDYQAGTIYFRQPIPRQDARFNPIFIVVDYEIDGNRSDSISGGGRAAVRLVDDRLEIGASSIHEDNGEIESTLYGTDATLRLGPGTELSAEYAHTEGDDFSGSKDGDAWLVELDHHGELLSLNAYAREQTADFGLGQQTGTETATRKFGLDTNYRLSDQVRLEGTAFRQENLATNADREVVTGEISADRGPVSVRGGARFTHESIDSRDRSAWQLLGGGQVSTLWNRLLLRADGEVALAEDQSGDFPHRLIAGADLELHERLAMFAEQEFTWGDEQKTADTRAGFRGNPWQGATLTTSVAQESREYGPRTYANLGLQQRWNATEHWTFDGSIDRAATIRDSGNQAFDLDVPAASGSYNDDYTAVSVGTGYRRDDWSLTGRLEARFGDREDTWGLLLGFLRDPNSELAYSGRLNFFLSETDVGTEDTEIESNLSVAYRPLDGPLIVFERIDVEYTEVKGGGFDFRTTKVLNHLKANQRWDRRTQIAWQYSTKYVVDTIDGQKYDTFGNLFGLEVRKDFARTWDMSMHGYARHQTGGDEVSTAYGMSVGKVVFENVWVSAGYNFVGFYDREFSESEYTAQGPYLRMRAKFDQNSVRDALRWFSR